MAKIHMIPWELAELSQLLKVYNRVYCSDSDPVIDELIKKIDDRLSEVPGGYSAKNPRGAGRHASITEEQKQEVLRLRGNGKSVRDIAKETGISKSKVHNLIKGQG